MKNSLTKYLVIFLLGMGLMLFLKQCNTEIIKVPITIEVEVPVIEKVHDTIDNPVPVPYAVKEIDTILVAKYKKSNDSLRVELFKRAVEINTYKEVFDDSIQTITVYAKTVGILNSLSVSYKTKPRVIRFDTILKIKVPKNDRSLSPYIEVGAPTKLGGIVILKVGADFKNKKNWILGFGYDTNETIWFKIGKTFNF